jgi:zinc protease
MSGRGARAWAPLLETLNENAKEHGEIRYVRTVPFGPVLEVDQFVLKNGLEILLVVDQTAPVIAYQTWFRVGSRHETRGKTGLAHLFEHLMFNEVEGLPAGAFDEKMEAAGADNNASTWLDFTQYQEAFPKAHLKMVADLEARRMQHLVLREPQVTSEKEVVKNERRYRVDDDVEGAVEELLWKTAFVQHPYHAPTIGWMEDIEGLSTDDCRDFYRAFYAPNNASLILVGDLNPKRVLALIMEKYGEIPPFALPLENSFPEPVQVAERIVESFQPTPTEKLVLGYKGPALGDSDHIVLTLLLEILTGSAASRIRRRLVRTQEIASDVSGFVGPHAHPSLIEISAAARQNHTAEELLSVIEEEIDRLKTEPVSTDELDRAKSRMELGLLGSMESAEGKASTIGFYQCVLGQPAEAISRLERAARVTPGDLRYAARRYLTAGSRTTLFVRSKRMEVA